MTEFDVMARDYIKLGFLNEVVNQNSVRFSVFLESEGIEKNFKDIRSEKNVYRFNNFNVSEDATQNTITFRPIVIGCYSYFKLETPVPLALDIIKNGTATIAKRFMLRAGEIKIEFDPQGTQKYIMKIEEHETEKTDNAITRFESGTQQNNHFTASNAATIPSVQTNYQETEGKRDQLIQSNSCLENDIVSLQAEIRALEAKKEQLILNKKNLVSHLEKLQTEYEKDYSSYETDIRDIKGRFVIDEELLKMYADKEVTPIEELILKSENDIGEMEEQARIFIEAQQRKTSEIESELKIGKKE